MKYSHIEMRFLRSVRVSEACDTADQPAECYEIHEVGNFRKESRLQSPIPTSGQAELRFCYGMYEESSWYSNTEEYQPPSTGSQSISTPPSPTTTFLNLSHNNPQHRSKWPRKRFRKRPSSCKAAASAPQSATQSRSQSSPNARSFQRPACQLTASSCP